MFRASAFAMSRWPGLRRWLNRAFYQYIARLDRRGEVTLMNYGYVALDPDTPPLPLDPGDEPNRTCLQLYHHVAHAVDLAGRDVLEVGSGRGGGASFVKRYHKPRALTGVDYSDRAVAFCQRTHRIDGLRFVHGDAESLPLDDGSFDAVINVESSHCYGSMPRFLAEAARVLRPGGHLLWADLRPPHVTPTLLDQARAAGFEIVQQETIAPNVMAALSHQAARNRALIERIVPHFARNIFYHFAGVEGASLIEQRLKSGELTYLRLALQKV